MRDFDLILILNRVGPYPPLDKVQILATFLELWLSSWYLSAGAEACPSLSPARLIGDLTVLCKTYNIYLPLEQVSKESRLVYLAPCV